jgi:hypothetical protein
MNDIYQAILNTPTYKKIVSYLIPQKITSFQSFDDKKLDVYIDRGQFSLATSDAYYSDGVKYRPFQIVSQYLQSQDKLIAIKEVLILGLGLASAVLMLEQKNNCIQHYDLVEIDANIAQAAKAVLALHAINNYTIHLQSAEQYLAQQIRQYDFVNLDVFSGRIVPPQMLTRAFHALLVQHIKPGGILSFNYIETSQDQTRRVQEYLNEYYSTVYVEELYYNKIFIAIK